MEYKPCPICNKEEKVMLRYPNMVCSECISTGIWANKEQTTPIEFGNTSFSGGFMSIINGIQGNQRICYINGKQCIADESRFGGIVVQCYNDDNKNDDDKEI
tara:strand:+ start:134 stop:439 length:306 start_codon:yes stop_codon:yes gene_type:complete